MALLPTSLRMTNAPAQNERRAWWISLFVLCAILGALIGLSFRIQNGIREKNVPASNYPALVQEYLILKKNVSDEQSTIKALRTDNAKLVSTTSTGGSQVKLLASDLSHANFLAGLTAVQGPGIVVTLTDGKKFPPGSPNFVVMQSMVHDADINQVVNELKAAGAEAISVNNQRLIASSPVRCAGPTVYVNFTPQTPPFTIKAIGSARDLQNALNLPNGVADGLRNIDPNMIKMQQSPRVVIPAYSGAATPKYAKPVAPAASGDTVASAKEQG